jgi:RimJ/RimL family protein N-acetyltransferase
VTVADLLRFRRIDRDDLEAYAAWFEDAETARRMSFPDPDWLDYVTHADGGSVAEVATLGPAAAPAAVLQYDIEGDGGISLLMAVRPDLRGRGVGFRVLEGFIARVADRFAHVDAWVDTDNAAALALLRKLSFRPVATLDEDGSIQLRRRFRD